MSTKLLIKNMSRKVNDVISKKTSRGERKTATNKHETGSISDIKRTNSMTGPMSSDDKRNSNRGDTQPKEEPPSRNEVVSFSALISHSLSNVIGELDKGLVHLDRVNCAVQGRQEHETEAQLSDFQENLVKTTESLRRLEKLVRKKADREAHVMMLSQLDCDSGSNDGASGNLNRETDKEIIRWIRNNYADYSRKNNTVAPPNRKPLERFRQTVRLLIKEMRVAKAINHNSRGIKHTRPGIARGSMNPKLMTTLHLTDMCMANPTVMSYLQRCLSPNLNDFDIFAFITLPSLRQHPLLVITEFISRQHSFLGKFQIPVDKLQSFLLEIEQGYPKSNPYHNDIHACDVLVTCNYILMHSDVFKKHLSDLDVLCMIIACVIHDVGHTGTNNNFHIKTKSPLSLTYNDQSILENYHLSLAFKLLRNNNHNFLENLTGTERSYFRNTVIQLVLGTDMTFHNRHMMKLEQLLDLQISMEVYKATQVMQQSNGGQTTRKDGGKLSFLGTLSKKRSLIAPGVTPSEDATDKDDDLLSEEKEVSSSNRSSALYEIELKEFNQTPMDLPRIEGIYSEKLLIMEIAVHLSDISNPCKPLEVSVEWSRLVNEEFRKQGDKERLSGLEISPMCDRNKPNLCKSSIGFSDFVVAPLLRQFIKFVPEIGSWLSNLESNKVWWKKQVEIEEEKQMEFKLDPYKPKPKVAMARTLSKQSSTGLITHDEEEDEEEEV